MKDILERTQGELVFTTRYTEEVRDDRDLELWRQMFTDRPRRPRGRARDLSRVVKTQFRAPPDVKTKRELDDTSSVVTGAESVGVLSRPESRVSRSSSCWTTRSGRDWYNPDNWRHGGLRYKFSCFGFYTLDILSGVFFKCNFKRI